MRKADRLFTATLLLVLAARGKELNAGAPQPYHYKLTRLPAVENPYAFEPEMLGVKSFLPVPVRTTKRNMLHLVHGISFFCARKSSNYGQRESMFRCVGS
jgi:hypothetical protein